MKRQANPPLSASGELALAQYEQALREQEDLTPASLRKYLSDLRHFIAWYEACAAECAPDTLVNSWFDLSAITTPTLTRYRTSLQTVQRQKPASVNRSLVSLKRSCSWAIQRHFITYDPFYRLRHAQRPCLCGCRTRQTPGGIHRLFGAAGP